MILKSFLQGSKLPNAKAAHTAHDTNLLPFTTVAVHVGTGGTVVQDLWGEGTDITETVADNTLILGNIKRIKAASTASEFVVYYVV